MQSKMVQEKIEFDEAKIVKLNRKEEKTKKKLCW